MGMVWVLAVGGLGFVYRRAVVLAFSANLSDFFHLQH